MKATHFLVSVLAISLLALQPKADAQSGSFHTNQRLSFLENKGQVKDQNGRPRNDLDYQLKVNSGFNVFIGPGLLQYQWAQPDAKTHGAPYTMQRLDVQLADANVHSKVEAKNKVNYYEAIHLSGVATEADAYQKVTYRDIYPHIDWVVYLKDNVAEYDFIVRPGGKVSDIKMRYGGALSLTLNGDGTINATTSMGTIKEMAPVSYASGKKVASAFTLQDGTVGFRTASYTGTLTIDPTLIWGTYLGGIRNEFAYCLATDRTGNVYVAGSTASTANIATIGSYQSTYAGGTGSTSSSAYVGDAYLAKFGPSGTPLWITYYGGPGADQGYSVTTDSANRVYLSGFTNSVSGIATTGSQQAALGGGTDAFLACFDSTGARQWATYFGGTANEGTMTSIHYSQSSGAIYLSGITSSSSGVATAGAQQTTFGGATDAFLAKYNLSGTLQWATYFGGSGGENNFAQNATDRFGNVYLCGITTSTAGITTTGSHQSAMGGGSNDGFLVKFNAAGMRQWATYYGGADYDRIHSIICNDSGFVYASGSTLSTSGIATAGSFQSAITSTSAQDNQFLVKFDSTGIRQWATYYSGDQAVSGITGSLSLGITGNVYMTGTTNATTGVATPGTLKDTLTAGTDAFLTKFSSGGHRLWGTYYGGGVDETGRSSATDRFGNIYICGETNSGNGIATTGAYQTAFGAGLNDGFVIKFNDCDTPATPGPITGPATVCKGSSYSYSVTAMSGALSYIWTLPNGWTGTSATNTITVQAGRDTGSIRVAGVYPCVNSPARTLAVAFLVDARISPAGNQAVCSGDTLTLHAPAGSFTYQWLNNRVAVAGATDSVFKAYQAGNYAVVVTGSGCTDTSAIDTFTVRTLPVPVITANGMTLSTGNFATYQWNFGNAPITGATAQTYTATLAGNYSVTVTDANGCKSTSTIYQVQASGIRGVNAAAVRLYPNPATSLIYIEAPIPVTTTISSMDGRVILHFAGSGEWNVGSLAAGLYLVRIADGQGNTLKVEKLTIAIR